MPRLPLCLLPSVVVLECGLVMLVLPQLSGPSLSYVKIEYADGRFAEDLATSSRRLFRAAICSRHRLWFANDSARDTAAWCHISCLPRRLGSGLQYPVLGSSLQNLSYHWSANSGSFVPVADFTRVGPSVAHAHLLAHRNVEHISEILRSRGPNHAGN